MQSWSKPEARAENIVKPHLLYQAFTQANFASTVFFQQGHTEADTKSIMSAELPMSVTKTMAHSL
jgi:hypothetical protein